MTKNIFFSAILHTIIIIITAIGFPYMIREPIDLPPIISVELIQISDKTNIPYAPKARKTLEKIKKKKERLVSEQAPPKIVKKEKPEAIPLPEDVKKQKKIEKKNYKLDPRFIFVNSGFNLRPTDISASIGLNQFKRLKNFMKIRSTNYKKIINGLKKYKNWNNQFTFLKINPNVKPSFFGFPILLNKRYLGKRKKYLNLLDKLGVETRPIISGNFLNQPAIKLFKLKKIKKGFIESQHIENLGFFIGIHIKTLSKKSLNNLINILLKIDTIK